MTAGARAVVIGIVGAEGTGKTRLARALAARLADAGLRAAMVGDVRFATGGAGSAAPTLSGLQEWADEQTCRIAAAATTHDVVIADTTAPASAIEADLACGDLRLDAKAGPAHDRCALSLLMALDLPVAGAGADHRAATDALLRDALLRTGRPFAVVTGRGEARLASAWRAVRQALKLPLPPDEDAAAPANWHLHCERCDVAACERHLLPRLPSPPAAG